MLVWDCGSDQLLWASQSPAWGLHEPNLHQRLPEKKLESQLPVEKPLGTPEGGTQDGPLRRCESSGPSSGCSLCSCGLTVPTVVHVPPSWLLCPSPLHPGHSRLTPARLTQSPGKRSPGDYPFSSGQFPTHPSHQAQVRGCQWPPPPPPSLA